LQHTINGVLICTNCDTQCPGFLFSFTQSSLQSTFALEIFTAFIWAFAASPGLCPIGVESGVGGRTKLDEYSLSQSKISQIMNWDTIRLQSPTLSNIISELEKTGLGNSSQLFLSIVPPLSLHRKLPDTYIVVENIHHKTKDFQRRGQWGEVFNMYYWLLHCFLEVPNHTKMPTGSNAGLEARSWVMAIAVSMEFLWSLGEEIQKHKNESLVLDNQLVRDHKHLRALLTNSKFHSLTKEVLLGLANLYDIQERKITWEPLRSFYNSHLRDSLIPRVTDLHHKIIKGEYKGDPIADVDQKDDLGWTALHYMAKEGRVNIISHLVENGRDLAPGDHADWRAINLLGWTPLHYAALNSSLKLDWAHDMDKQKFDVNIQGRDGVSPLHCAGRSNNIHMATHLIRLGANLGARDNSRKTPLHWSAYHCSTETFELMLASGAEFRSPDEYGRTCLHLAGMAGSMEIVAALLKVMNVAEINLKERGGRTALVMACIFGHENVLETLRGHSNDIIPDGLLYVASKKGLSNTVKSLLQQPTNKSPTKEECERSLYIASKHGHVEIVRLLLENREGVGSGITSGDRSPLFAASKYYHLETIKLLLGEGFRMTGDRKKWEMLLAEEPMREENEIFELLSNMLNEGNDALSGGSKYHNTISELDDSDESSPDSDGGS
jgi:ankyrin repeat protein